MAVRRKRSFSLRTETDIKRETLEALELAYPKPNAWWSRNNSSGRVRRMSQVGLGKGSADIVGCVSLRFPRYTIGVFVAVELKTSTGKQSEEQVLWAAMHEHCGGIYVIATSAQEAVNMVNLRLARLYQHIINSERLAA